MLEVYNCNNMPSLPHWLGELTSLEKLKIWECQGIKSLPESIQHLTNLQELHLFLCFELRHLVESSEENKMELTGTKGRVCVLPTSLKKRVIEGCDGISSFPEGIHQLTNLQELKFISSRQLENKCIGIIHFQDIRF